MRVCGRPLDDDCGMLRYRYNELSCPSELEPSAKRSGVEKSESAVGLVRWRKLPNAGRLNVFRPLARVIELDIMF